MILSLAAPAEPAAPLLSGKPKPGYVGDLVVNVSGGAELVNKTEGKHPTAVFVTDKTMNHPSYNDVVIEVNIEDIEITGDILRVSDLTNKDEKENAKGSTTSLNISNVTVTGDVANQSSNGNLLIDSSTVTGMVSNANEDATISINNSNVGSISGDEHDNIILPVIARLARSLREATGVAMVNGKIYSDLNAAITAAEDDDTITLLQNIDKLSELTTDPTSGSNISPAEHHQECHHRRQRLRHCDHHAGWGHKPFPGDQRGGVRPTGTSPSPLTMWM